MFHRQCSQCLLPWLQVRGCSSKPKISPRALQCCCRGGWQSPGTATLQHLQCSSGMGEASLPPAAFPVLLESTTTASGLPQEHAGLAPACCRQHPPSPAHLQHAECSAKGQKGTFWWPASNMGPSWPRLMKIIVIKNPVPSIPCTTRAKSACELVRLGAFPVLNQQDGANLTLTRVRAHPTRTQLSRWPNSRTTRAPCDPAVRLLQLPCSWPLW